MRKDKQLLISTVKPHGSVSKQTVGRWIKITMLKAGIQEYFKPHSTRHASTSYALYKGVPLTEIIKAAGWNNSSTFEKFYNKTFSKDTNELQMSIIK
jgi:site-specific recombinase XerD